MEHKTGLVSYLFSKLGRTILIVLVVHLSRGAVERLRSRVCILARVNYPRGRLSKSRRVLGWLAGSSDDNEASSQRLAKRVRTRLLETRASESKKADCRAPEVGKDKRRNGENTQPPARDAINDEIISTNCEATRAPAPPLPPPRFANRKTRNLFAARRMLEFDCER